MFGRRTPETLPATPPRPSAASVDVDILANLPELPVSPLQGKPAPDSPFERAWQAEPVEAFTPNIPDEQIFVPTQQLYATEAADEPSEALPAALAATTAPTLLTKAATESVIGPDDFFDGNYRSERGVRLQGNVRGSIESRQYIYVEVGAHVEASLSAEEIVISGDFSGTIECRQRLEISATGRVQGEVTTALLVVHEGGLLDGQLHMQPAA
ncbi:MAG: polymer-forming cytoskeletal protein [Roseiflexaceae bacterium]|nr:polymer-forming cytoskeletal protein [Roseiflexaceae bacterium]